MTGETGRLLGRGGSWGEEKGQEGRPREVFRAEGGACAESFVISETD